MILLLEDSEDRAKRAPPNIESLADSVRSRESE